MPVKAVRAVQAVGEQEQAVQVRAEVELRVTEAEKVLGMDLGREAKEAVQDQGMAMVKVREMVLEKELAKGLVRVMVQEAVREWVVVKVPAVKGPAEKWPRAVMLDLVTELVREKVVEQVTVPAVAMVLEKVAVPEVAAVPVPEAEPQGERAQAVVLEKVKDLRRELGLVKMAVREAVAAADKVRAVDQAPEREDKAVVPELMIFVGHQLNLK